MNQEMAGVISFIREALSGQADEVNFFNHEMPQDFELPCVYFPTPKISAVGATLNSFKRQYEWGIEFFHVTKQAANGLSLAVLNNLQKKRGLVELVEENGDRRGEYFRLGEPRIEDIKGAVARLIVTWDSFEDYDSEVFKKSASLHAKLHIKL